MTTTAWRDAVAEGRLPAPVVLVLGGFLTAPPVYDPFVRHLRALGAADVVVANVWTPDWLLAGARGLGPTLTRSGRALLAASARSGVVAQGAPLLVIGHSAGGVSARIMTSPVPYAGRPQRASGRIGAIVTLGTPHLAAPDANRGMRAGADAAAFANREVPGTTFAPQIGYLCIASTMARGRRHGTVAEQRAWGLYRTVLGRNAGDDLEGDGVVPLRSALLPGAPSIVYPDAWHGQYPGRDWYGSGRFVRDWWPAALETWQAALRARVNVAQDPPL
jgi:hypothetical protein